uniref:Pyridine nucleotide-disulfide oxidoreductase domain-containing protein 1 n=1 Tax=Plectus sambesii TaxID=2011161 RepID=A0A914W1R7_9BILA
MPKATYTEVGRVAESFDVTEQKATSIFADYPNITVVPAKVASLDYSSKCVRLDGGGVVRFKKLCIATGARPKMQFESDFVLAIRDTETVKTFQRRLKDAKRIVIVGNGGIATELVYGLRNVDIIWAVKHSSISATFFDAGAGQFFLPELMQPSHDNEATAMKRLKYTTDSPAVDTAASPSITGSALGPDWSTNVEIKGAAMGRHVRVVYGVELDAIVSPADFRGSQSRITPLPTEFEEKQEWNVYVKLSNGEIYGCDLIVSAIGVDPNSELWTDGNPTLKVASDGGLEVNEQMETSLSGVYAAGDVCTTGWSPAPHWMQMRLWTQARQMGAYAARCMAASNPMQLDICFEIFTHVTSFFGLKVILLGKYNGQGLGAGCHALLRVQNGEEYVKVLVEDGRVHGAVLVGETDLEETLENLILNQTDISHIEDGLLDPSIDIEDYFD